MAVVLSGLTIRYLMKERLYLVRVIPTALVKIVFSIVIVILVYRKSRCFFKSEYIKYGLKISTPLIAHGVALSVLSQSDRMMITWFAGASQTGIYSVIYNFSMIATALTSSLEGIWMPWFLDRMKGRMLDDIRRIAKDYVNLMTYILAALILISPEVIKMLTERSYGVGISIVPPIVLANFIILIYTLYVDVEYYYKKTPEWNRVW